MKIGKIVLLSLFVFMVTAAPITSILAGVTPPVDIITDDIDDFVFNIVEWARNWFFALLGLIVVIFLLLAAYHFITASGSEEKVNKGRDMVKWAIIGIAVMLLAGGAYALVQSLLQVV